MTLPLHRPIVSRHQYDQLCRVIDRAKNGDRSEDTGTYADEALHALRLAHVSPLDGIGPSSLQVTANVARSRLRSYDTTATPTESQMRECVGELRNLLFELENAGRTAPVDIADEHVEALAAVLDSKLIMKLPGRTISWKVGPDVVALLLEQFISGLGPAQEGA